MLWLRKFYKRRRKCNCFKILEQFTGDNATCDVCLAARKRWADKSPGIVKELWQKYHDEHREEVISKKKLRNGQYEE